MIINLNKMYITQNGTIVGPFKTYYNKLGTTMLWCLTTNNIFNLNGEHPFLLGMNIMREQ